MLHGFEVTTDWKCYRLGGSRNIGLLCIANGSILVVRGANMSKAIEDLRHDHDAINTAFLILDGMIERFQKNGDLDRVDSLSFIGFLKEFADKCHHGKEEGILFPELIKAGIPQEGGPIGVMLSEHVEGRRLIKEMEESVGQKPDLTKFINSAHQYESLLKNHIQKENNVLFPMADRTLDSNRMTKIYEAFEEHEEKVIGKGRHEQLHELLKTLKKKYVS